MNILRKAKGQGWVSEQLNFIVGSKPINEEAMEKKLEKIGIHQKNKKKIKDATAINLKALQRGIYSDSTRLARVLNQLCLSWAAAKNFFLHFTFKGVVFIMNRESGRAFLLWTRC